MNRIKPIFLQTIQEYNMLCREDSVTVAFSGGADSTALLVLLQELRDEYGFTLRAAHLNHGLRGAESDRDEAFAREFCERRGIESFCEKADVAAIAKEMKISIEVAARNVRYEFLHRVAGNGKIATAHNADDNVETILLNLTRGSGAKGLCGIPPTNGQIIRPLIHVPSADIRNFCEENGIPYVVDSSNLSDDYTRNKLRHHVLPVLRELSPAMAQTAAHTAKLLRQDVDFLETQAARALVEVGLDGGLDAKKLCDLHPAIRSRVLRLYAENCGLTLDRHHTEELTKLLESGAGRRQLTDGYSAELLKRKLTIGKALPLQPFEMDFSTLSAQIGDRFIRGKICEKNKIHNLFLKHCIDYGKIGDNLTLRSRKNGDTFAPAGRGCTKTLKKLFNEAGIPATERDTILILSDENGILWVEGFGAAENAAVNADTDTVLMLDISGRA